MYDFLYRNFDQGSALDRVAMFLGYAVMLAAISAAFAAVLMRPAMRLLDRLRGCP